MNARDLIRKWLVLGLTPLGAIAAGVVVAWIGGGEALLVVSAVSFAVFVLASIVLRLGGFRRCPACGDRRFPREPTRGIYECDACGQRFRRVRQGAATWLDLDDPPPVAGKAVRRARHGVYEVLPQSPDGRWSWIDEVLPRLRALRQRLRPLAGKPIRVLNLIKPRTTGAELPEPFSTVAPPNPAPVPLWRDWTWRSVLTTTCAAVVIAAAVIAAAVLSMIPTLGRLHALDDVYWIIVVFAIGVCECMVLVIGQMLRLTRTAMLALFATDLSLKALHLAAIGWLPDAYVLGSMAVVYPATPLLLGPLFRRWRAAEEAAGEFTSGQLLRNKQVRDSRRTARRAG